jgi:FemAB-related protein (PEP-CTERM system-associated)
LNIAFFHFLSQKERDAMEIKLCKTADEKIEWDEYVANSELATAYHLYGWKNVIEKSFGHKTFYLMAKDGGKIRGVLPLVFMKSRMFGTFLCSLPFLNYGGISADNDKITLLLFEKAVDIAKKESVRHIEFRHVQKRGLDLPSKVHKVTMILNLPPNSENLWKKFRSEIRNRIRKAEKAGLKINKGDITHLDDFYRVFAINMRDLGTPVYSKTFFKNMLEEFPDSVRIFSVLLKHEVIGAGILVFFKDTLEMPWVSSMRKYFKLAPNNLLYWEAIKYACEKGLKYFDFGRSSWNSGTFTFKKRWGAQPKQLHWQYWLRQGSELPEVNPDNPKYGTAIKIWQKLPVPITKLIGPRIVKYIP